MKHELNRQLPFRIGQHTKAGEELPTDELIVDQLLDQHELGLQEMAEDSLLPVTDSFLPAEDGSLLTPVLGKGTETTKSKGITPKLLLVDDGDQ